MVGFLLCRDMVCRRLMVSRRKGLIMLVVS